MKKFLVAVAMAGVLSLGSMQKVYATDAEPTTAAGEAQTEETESSTTTGGVEGLGLTDGDSGISETDFTQFVDVPTPTIDANTSRFFETFGGKILGLLLKVLSVGLVLTCIADMCFVAVPATQSIFLALERSGIPIVSNEAHKCAGVAREQKAGADGAGGSGLPQLGA